MTGASGFGPMFEKYFGLKRRHSALLAWQMGDWFEFYFNDAERVAAILGVALSTRGKRPNGKPIPMCAVPADTRFTVLRDCLLVPLDPTDHFFGKIVQAGYPLAVALHVEGRDADAHEHRIVAVFHPGDFPRAAVGNVITLVGPLPSLTSVQ